MKLFPGDRGSHDSRHHLSNKHSFLNRNSLLIVVYAIFPFLAYVAASLTYPMFDLEGINLIKVLSIVPAFNSFFDTTVKVFGEREGHRLFITLVFFMAIFLVQNVVNAYLAVIDGINSNLSFHSWRLREIVSVLVMLAAFYAFFFVPSITEHSTSRAGIAVQYSDLKYPLIAGCFFLFSIVPYQVIFALSRVLYLLRKEFLHPSDDNN